jgi:hypothetical protein
MGKGARLARRVPPVRTRPADPRTVARRWAVGGIVAVLSVITGMVAVRAIGGPPAPPQAKQPAGQASAQLLAAISGIPGTTFDRVGVGKVDSLPKRLNGQPPLADGGKPLVVYIGAEYCPFCAAQRWPLVVALSRFGTFGGLSTTHSASDDVYANTATVSFHGASYTSQWLVFQGVETNTNVRKGNGYTPLDSLTAQQRGLLSTYDAPPYVPASSAGAIPFLDLGNAYVITGASISPQLLEGRTADEIAAALANPDDPLAQAILGAANAFTAMLCRLTANQPANVCTSPGVASYQDRING